MIWGYVLLSVFFVSLVSFAGVFFLGLKEEKLKKILLYLVSFSAGALLGDVFLHILPEMAEAGFGTSEGVYILAGIVLFFALERFVFWHHSHSEHSEEIHSSVYLTQAADSLHNFVDGIIIAASYFISIPVGIATTMAVIFHEIPQEIGNFGVLLHGGWSKSKALWYNFFSALSAVLGALVVLVFARGDAAIPSWLTALAAASFIYIAMSDLIPELQKVKEQKKSILLLLTFIFGALCMALLLLAE